MLKTYVCTSQGGREYMEDTYCIEAIHKEVQMYGVFDGHNGIDVANTCKVNFPKIFTQCFLNKTMSDVSETLHKTFKSVDELVQVANNANIGSTAVVCVVTPDKLWFANAGDSMAMVYYTDGHVELMSQEHKAESEKDRITAAGGMITYWDGMGRVNGTLNLSRSIGDFYMKQFIISTPFVRSIKRHLRPIKYILIASDGLWDVFSADEIHKQLQVIKTAIGKNNQVDMDKVLSILVERAHQRGSTDNITVCYIEI